MRKNGTIHAVGEECPWELESDLWEKNRAVRVQDIIFCVKNL